jgi:hypothetical protein
MAAAAKVGSSTVSIRPRRRLAGLGFTRPDGLEHFQQVGDFDGTDGQIKLRVTALSGDRPLTPLSGEALLNGAENKDTRATETLTFLSYKEKFLAGSWRFNTYFGRDTLMSVRLLMAVLAPDAIEAGIRSVLARLAPDGEVAHEEAIGELAELMHKQQDGSVSNAPIFDYSMIDGNFLLAPVAAYYLLEAPQGKRRASLYLRESVETFGGPTSVGQELVRNLRLVTRSAAVFATHPRVENLIALKPGHTAGQWRDSADGIGGGRYPYDVNAIFAPAAHARLAKLSVDVSPIQVRPWGERNFRFADPDGYAWEYSEPL